MYHPAYHATAKPDINVYVKSPLFKVGSDINTVRIEGYQYPSKRENGGKDMLNFGNEISNAYPPC